MRAILCESYLLYILNHLIERFAIMTYTCLNYNNIEHGSRNLDLVPAYNSRHSQNI